MTFLNIGPLEFILIFVLAIIVLGPERMLNAARAAGRWISQTVRSPLFRTVMTTSREIRDLPTKIVRESGMDETMKEIEQTTQEVNDEVNQTVKEVSQEVTDAAKDASSEAYQAVRDVNNTVDQAQVAAMAGTPQAKAAPVQTPYGTPPDASGYNADSSEPDDDPYSH